MTSIGFSYAQAAKGLVTPTTTSSATSENGSKESTNPARSMPKSDSPITLPKATNKSSPSIAAIDDIETKNGVEDRKVMVADVEDVAKVEEVLSMDTSIISTTEGDNEEQKASSLKVATSKERAKELDDDWEKVSVPSQAADKELKAAPAPVFNVWQQRQEAQNAKMKPASQPQRTHVTTKAPVEDVRKKSLAKDENTRDIRKTSPNSTEKKAQQAGSPSTAAGVRQEKSVTAATTVPPADAASWPSMGTVPTDNVRRSSAVEKPDNPEEYENKASSSKTTWKKVPLEYSVAFETPGIQNKPPRRGGRGGARGGQSGQTEKGRESRVRGDAAASSAPKQNSGEERGRKAVSRENTRNSSVPSEVPRNDALEPEAPPFEPAHLMPNMVVGNVAALLEQPERLMQTPSTGDVSTRSSSKQPHGESLKGLAVDMSDTLQHTALTQDLASPSKSQFFGSRQSTFDTTRGSVDQSSRKSREWAREQSNGREKIENWRGSERRGERGDRGRGTYSRVKGHHAQNHSYTAPLPQAAFETARSERSRQTTNHHIPGSPYGSTRGTHQHRGNAIPAMTPQFFNPPPYYPNMMHPLQTGMEHQPSHQPMTASTIMNASPFGQHLPDFALMSMVATQLEYYFSLDNLLKDMFLRKNMDNQGFVRLSVIHQFKRINQMIGDGPQAFENLRLIAQQSPRSIEYSHGQNGEGRIRSRENWKDFILPEGERIKESLVDAMSPQQAAGMNGSIRSPQVNGYHSSFEAALSQHKSTPSRQSIEQWAAQNATTDQQSALSPPPKMTPSDNENSTFANGNAHATVHGQAIVDENTFPDESVAALKVVVRDPDYIPVDQHSSPSQMAVPRNHAIDTLQHLQAVPNRQPSFGTSRQTIYLPATDASPPTHLNRPGYIHEDYLSLLNTARDQREQSHFEGASLVLYPLWADFLTKPNQFNVGMYEDFKNWALEDEAKGNANGKKHLVRFFEIVLNDRPREMSLRLAKDVVEISRLEKEVDFKERHTWRALKAAWRNGATNMKTRKRLMDLLSQEEQGQLDRGS